MNVSVIVPVYNNKLRLEKCLLALSKQTFPRDKYEIIVVDNDSTDGSNEIAAKYSNKVLLQSRIKSPYPTRNLGIKHAQGYYKILLDSNIVVPEEFLSIGINYLKSTNSDFGAPTIKFEISPKSTTWELLDSIIYANVKVGIKNNTVPGGCIFTQGQFFERFGYFDETLRSNGDTVWSRNATNKGAKLIHIKNLTVTYPPKKKKDLLKKAKRIGRGNRMVWIKSGKSLYWIFVKSIWSMRPISYKKFVAIIESRREPNIYYPPLKLWLYNWVRIIYTCIGRLGF